MYFSAEHRRTFKVIKDNPVCFGVRIGQITALLFLFLFFRQKGKMRNRNIAELLFHFREFKAVSADARGSACFESAKVKAQLFE